MEKNTGKKQTIYVIATEYDGITYYWHKKGGFKWNVWGNDIARYKTLSGVIRAIKKFNNRLFGVKLEKIYVLQGEEGMTLGDFKLAPVEEVKAQLVKFN